MTSTDLLAGATEARARELSRDLEEPDWLLDERLDAVRLVADLPDESNTLWTTYLDLRPVRFEDVTPRSAADHGLVPPAADDAALPDGAAALIHIAAGRVVGRARSQQALEAGVFVGTFIEALRQPGLAALVRSAIEGGRSIGSDTELAHQRLATAAVLP